MIGVAAVVWVKVALIFCYNGLVNVIKYDWFAAPYPTDIYIFLGDVNTTGVSM